MGYWACAELKYYYQITSSQYFSLTLPQSKEKHAEGSNILKCFSVIGLVESPNAQIQSQTKCAVTDEKPKLANTTWRRQSQGQGLLNRFTSIHSNPLVKILNPWQPFNKQISFESMAKQTKQQKINTVKRN